jgi:methionyl-tRNA synthetase
VWHEDAAKIHVIGKNVWKFHSIYWPALLLSAGLPLPNKIVVHGFLTVDGKKISKSLGNAVDPESYIDTFGADGVRHYLLRHVKPFEDSDFSVDKLRASYDADLANGLGNLCSRLTALCDAAGYDGPGLPPDPPPPEGYHAALERFAFDEVVEVLWREIRALNRDIEEEAPWALLKGKDAGPLRELLSRWIRALYALAHWLSPFLPQSSGRIIQALSLRPISRSGPLFPRIES